MELKTKLEQNLKEAAKFANLAPSSHNSQPWELVFVQSEKGKDSLEKFFQLEHNTSNLGYIIICLNKKRNLIALKAHRLEMLMSCGAFLELLAQNLKNQGWNASYCWANENGIPSLKELFDKLPEFWEPVTIFALNKEENTDKVISQVDIKKRTTNRGPYKTNDINISPENAKKLQSLSFPEKVKDCQVTLVQEKEQIKKFASFVARYGDTDFTHKQAWRETYSFIHFSDSQIEKAEYGFGVTHIFGPMSKFMKKFYQIFLHPKTMQILKYFGYAKYVAYEFGKLVNLSPMLAYLNFKDNQPNIATQIAGGSIMMNFWLKMAEHNLALHPVSIILQHKKIRIKLQKEMELPEGRAFFFTRIGVPIVDFPPSLRRKNLSIMIE